MYGFHRFRFRLSNLLQAKQFPQTDQSQTPEVPDIPGIAILTPLISTVDVSAILRSQQLVNLQENCFEQQRSGIEGIQSTPHNSNQRFLKGSM